MSAKSLLTLSYLLCVASTIDGFICNSSVSVNQSPVIGVLAQETWNKGLPPNNSVIVASYVKFLEMAGAQVVPVLLNKNNSYYDDLYSKLNGLLLPGGILVENSIYMQTAQIFWEKATNNNSKLAWRPITERKTNFFPIWGTCLGFEAMFDFISGQPSRFTDCNAFDMQNSVQLTRSNQILRKSSKIFRNAPVKILNFLNKHNTTINFHHRCMSIRNVTEYALDKNIQILGTNRDVNGLKHVSIIEAKYYPFFGVQFHPEAVLFEFKDFVGFHHIPHGLKAIEVSQYFANFFVRQTLKNKNCFNTQEDLNTYLIYNYQAEFTVGNPTDGHMQKYFFPL